MSLRLTSAAALLVSATGIVATAASEIKTMAARTLRSSVVQLPEGGTLSSLGQATAWLNSQPLKPADLRGKVVLIDFWTYTCINWIRTAPYIRAWAEKYKDHGLIVVGVHTPEFGFEKDIDNVRRAVSEQKLGYPVAVDSDYAIWWAFDNRYWPALYFIDTQGRIRHHQFGEGNYERAELIIQRLLSEARRGAPDQEFVTVDARGAEADADWKNLKSPETYVGYARAENFASPGGFLNDRPRAYAIPASLKLNEWALAGDWTMQREFVAANQANGRIAFRFHARDLHLVMTPSVRGKAVRFRVLLDGRPPEAAHGLDVDEQGHGKVDTARMYQLIRQQAPIDERQFEIEFLDPGVEVYVFTFG
jgi:thiol-disulfide isomerase/thioredoxin